MALTARFENVGSSNKDLNIILKVIKITDYRENERINGLLPDLTQVSIMISKTTLADKKIKKCILKKISEGLNSFRKTERY